MRIYLAARYSRFEEMQGYATTLEAMGHTITSRWIRGDHDLRAHGESESERFLIQWAQEDLADLRQADICLSFTEGPGDIPGRSRGGRHVEQGMALAMQKRCIVIGSRENVFHFLPQIEFYATWASCLAALTGASLEAGLSTNTTHCAAKEKEGDADDRTPVLRSV